MIQKQGLSENPSESPAGHSVAPDGVGRRERGGQEGGGTVRGGGGAEERAGGGEAGRGR